MTGKLIDYTDSDFGGIHCRCGSRNVHIRNEFVDEFGENVIVFECMDCGNKVTWS